MRHFFRSFSRKDYIFFLVCGVAYYMLIKNYLFLWDDLDYRFQCGEEGYKFVDNFSDLITSQIYHYKHLNGRFLVHCFVQFFCGYGGFTLYYLVSTLFFVLLLMSGIYLFKRKNHGRGKLCNSLFLCLLYLLIPQIGTVFFGSVAFVCNYMYSCAVYLFFYAYYKHVKEDNVSYHWLGNIILFIFGLFCGSWQESFSMGIAGALLIYHTIDLWQHRKVKEQYSLFWLVVGFGIGSLIVILAPGNFVRADIVSAEHSDVISRLKGILMYNLVVIVSIIIILLSCYLDYVKKQKYLFIRKEAIILLAMLIAGSFAIFVVYNGARQLTMVGLFGVYLIIVFLYEYADKILSRFNNLITICSVVICLSIYIPSMYYMSRLHKAESAFLNEAFFEKKNIVIDSEFEHIDRQLLANSIIRRYINAAAYTTNEIYANQFFTKKISTWLTKGETDTICTLLLPESMEDIINKCTSENNVCENIWYSSYLNYYILRLPKGTDVKTHDVVFTVEPTTIVQKIKYMILGKKKYRVCLDIPTQEIRHFEYDDYDWYIITHHVLYDTNLSEMYFI